VAELKGRVSPASVGALVSALASATHAFAPTADWAWLSRLATRLKLKARPSRDKRHAMQHTAVLFAFGKELMDIRDARGRGDVAAAQRYMAGLMIALLAARPLRVRNFQAITIGTSLAWDGARYWLVFGSKETKTGRPINEPFPDDLVPYLENYLRIWRPILVRQCDKFGGDPTHRRLWVGRAGAPLKESAFRDTIKRYTRKRFGTALWPHLFRDCLLTSLADDQPDLMAIGPALLGHASVETGEKHYNQGRMKDAGRRFAGAIADLRESFMSVREGPIRR
jgi:integrase/recombinase XerD